MLISRVVGVILFFGAIIGALLPALYRGSGDEIYQYVLDTVPSLANDELIINTNKGQKSIVLNGESIMNKVVAGSTWLQLAVGSNVVVCTNSLDGAGMLYSVKANERYL